MRINNTVWIILGILIAVIIIVNVYSVWSSLEGQKEKIKEFLYTQNPGKALSELQSGKITVSQYCNQLPDYVLKSQATCAK
jgi:hypothetical protein